MSKDKDIGLATLLDTRALLGANLSDDLLRQCFEVQRRHQYNHDRTSSLQAIEKLIDAYVDTAIAATSVHSGQK